MGVGQEWVKYSFCFWYLVLSSKVYKTKNFYASQQTHLTLSSAFRPTPVWKPASRADVSVETGFYAGVGRNADWIIFFYKKNHAGQQLEGQRDRLLGEQRDHVDQGQAAGLQEEVQRVQEDPGRGSLGGRQLRRGQQEDDRDGDDDQDVQADVQDPQRHHEQKHEKHEAELYNQLDVCSAFYNYLIIY